MTSDKSKQTVLFISNGHGEDLNASEVLKALKENYPNIKVAALPMVGEGNAYRKLGVEIIAPTLSLPSGGFVYMDKRQLFTDVQKGLLKLTWQQIKAARAFAQNCDLIFATGDIVPLAIARLTGCPYTAFIVSSSAHYENRMQPPFVINWLMRSPLCKKIFTRDAFTAQLMKQQGISKAIFAGYPIMDVLEPKGIDLGLNPEIPMIALLPGSRLPEACQNLGLMLDLVVAIAEEFSPSPVQFRAALVPSMLSPEILEKIAHDHNWQFEPPHKFMIDQGEKLIEVLCPNNSFADVLHQCNLVIGMAGTAVEQAVGLGKPVIQILGQGPQFTYSFAEAQMRLLGISVQTIGKTSATATILKEAANQVKLTLHNPEYLNACKNNGIERVGLKGGSARIADHIAKLI
ncbi:hypothetical protein Syn7502_00511 [Synechococcus sp. PCC 7502]|uniref:lipid-A-disaccharide synthase-related protein n=1 Tax=Synechococcus sp. PCC 7502 TaxID=1173263 RepID=UPI00029FA88B|nr:lipid-A-disaccharide synthase-related protein [Synechococcus sp. PCC 7502]AFY72669.1 hypothetical protein Syn7502_00511 [Synechococcus sp. PCC 7502]